MSHVLNRPAENVAPYFDNIRRQVLGHLPKKFAYKHSMAAVADLTAWEKSDIVANLSDKETATIATEALSQLSRLDARKAYESALAKKEIRPTATEIIEPLSDGERKTLVSRILCELSYADAQRWLRDLKADVQENYEYENAMTARADALAEGDVS